MPAYAISTREEPGDRSRRHAVTADGAPLSFRDVARLWQESERFRTAFVEHLRAAPYAVYRWETPPVTTGTFDRPFEWVLVDAPGIDRPADPRPFREHFGPEAGAVVQFENLGGDAWLVVPTPRGAPSAYPHLAAFVRHAPDTQVHALWQAVGEAVEQRVREEPLWLSTAGGGVAWLHVRLDDQPKYYAYLPFASR